MLETLETVEVEQEELKNSRFPIQCLIESDGSTGFAGRVEGGQFQVGDAVTILPEAQVATIEKIMTYQGEQTSASQSDSCVVYFKESLSLKRGQLMVKGIL